MFKNFTLALVLIAGVTGAAWAQSSNCTTQCYNIGTTTYCDSQCYPPCYPYCAGR